MQRDSALALVLALLALLAIGVAGATLDNPAATPGSGSGFGSGSGSGFNPGNNSAPMNATTGGAPGAGAAGAGFCLTILQSLPVRLALALGVVTLAVHLGRKARSRLVGLWVFCGAGLITTLSWWVLSNCGPLVPPMQTYSPRSGLDGPNSTGNASGGSGMDGAINTVATQPSLLLGVVLVLIIAVAVLVLVVASGDADRTSHEPDDEPPEPEPESDVAAVGRAAGRAADRIDREADLGNEVYRAWAEMTDHLAVSHPESSTPAEFADAAVAAGMAPDDVRELTGLFEEVRYGDYEATPERENRAVSALRRIETAYAGGDDDSGGNAATDGGIAVSDRADDPATATDDDFGGGRTGGGSDS